jgi:hypothetical protein
VKSIASHRIASHQRNRRRSRKRCRVCLYETKSISRKPSQASYPTNGKRKAPHRKATKKKKKKKTFASSIEP